MSFPWDMHPSLDQLHIDVIFDVKPGKKLGKHAEAAVNVEWGWSVCSALE